MIQYDRDLLLVMLVRAQLLGDFARPQAALSKPGAGTLGGALD